MAEQRGGNVAPRFCRPVIGPHTRVFVDAAQQDVAMSGPTAKPFPGSQIMKSFQVTDFNAPLQEVDQPTPKPSGTQVLIKVKAAGVCHSDLHIWEGGYDLGHGRKPLS